MMKATNKRMKAIVLNCSVLQYFEKCVALSVSENTVNSRHFVGTLIRWQAEEVNAIGLDWSKGIWTGVILLQLMRQFRLRLG